MQFRKEVERVARKFAELPKRATIRIVSHLDADGISSASILISALRGRAYGLSILPQLTEKALSEFANEKYDAYVFCDLGTNVPLVLKYIRSKVFIIDHHSFKPGEEAGGLVVNPMMYGIDGTREIACSGVAYLFSRALDASNRLAYLGVIGAIGDLQENRGFSGLNKEILEDAVTFGQIRVSRGWFGAETKPLHRLLASNPDMPEIGGSTAKALELLKQLGIPVKDDDGWRRYTDLSKDEQKRLLSRVPGGLGLAYELKGREGAIKDARQFSTMLNACGRMGKASLGIGACLEDPNLTEKAIACISDYRREIVAALKWFANEKERVIRHDSFYIVNFGDVIRPTIAGTLATIISKSNPGVKVVLTLARNDDRTTKVSARMSPASEVDLAEILREMADHLGGESGGHRTAAGAVIPTEHEKVFIEKASIMLSEKLIEEKISSEDSS